MPQITDTFDLANGLSRILASLHQANQAALTGSSGASAPDEAVTNPYQFFADTTVRAFRQFGDAVSSGSRPLWTLEGGPLAIIPAVLSGAAPTIPDGFTTSGGGLKTFLNCDTTSTAINVTLPDADSATQAVIWFYFGTRGGSNNVTVTAAGTDTIENPSGLGTVTSFLLENQGDIVCLYTNGAPGWRFLDIRVAGVTTRTATATLTFLHRLCKADATAGAMTISLPTPSKCNGQRFQVIKTDASGNAVTVDVEDASNINGSSSASLASQYDTGLYVSDGTQYWIAA